MFVTIRLPVVDFLSVVHGDNGSIWYRYGDMDPQKYWGHEFDLLGSRYVIGHVTIRLPGVDFLSVVHKSQYATFY